MAVLRLILFIQCLVITGLASGNVCNNSPYSSMKPFAAYAPAQSYCWDHYPGSTYWKTSTKPVTTTTVTITGTYTTTTTSTSTATVCTSIVSKLVKKYVDLNAKKDKRTPQTLYEAKRDAAAVPAPTPNANDEAAAWKQCSSTMAKCGDKCFSTGCSCIETPKTSTKWIPATKTYTRTSKTYTKTTTTVTATTTTSTLCTSTTTTITTITIGNSS